MAYGGYAGREALAEAIEISPSTLQRIEGLAEPARPLKRAELLAIAEACNVPVWFLEHGWTGREVSLPPGADVDTEGRRALADLDRRRTAGEDQKRKGA